MIDSLRYVIVIISDITDEMVANAKQESIDTLRKDLEGNKAILKWLGDTPSCFEGMTIYNNKQMREIVSGSDWTPTEGG